MMVQSALFSSIQDELALTTPQCLLTDDYFLQLNMACFKDELLVSEIETNLMKDLYEQRKLPARRQFGCLCHSGKIYI